MNKIFKVVWNRTIGSFVVTSELAKGRVKSSSEGAEGDVRASEEGRLKTLFRLTALSAALFGLSESAWAHPIINSEGGKVATGGASETAIGGGSARGVGSVAVGAFAKAGTRIEADGAIAIGGSQASTGAYADGNNSIAIGQASNANANKATSIGSDTIASQEWTSAIGARAEATNVGATSLGSWTQATGEYSIAVGGSDAQGRAANAGTLASGSRSTAIGRNAKSAGADAIALGTGTQAKESDTVAVGTAAQATLANSIAIGKNSVATGVFASDRKGRAIAVGFNAQALGEDSVAIGSGVDANAAALAKNRQSVALGWQARATGTTQAVAIGPEAFASGAQSTSIGNNTRATGASSIAIGGDDWDDAKKSVNAQYKVLTGSDMSSGYQGTTSATAAVAVGVKAQATGALSTAFGPGTIASGLGASAFGVGASATQDKSVAIGAGSHTNTDATAVTTATVNGITYSGFAGTTHITSGSQVSFGSAGYERQLKHVAPGAITATSTDAINGSQLYALHAGSGNIAKAVADALGGGAAVGIDPTNNQGTVTLPSYDVLKGSDKPNTAGNGTAKFNTTPAKNVAAAMTNLNTYVNQGFAVKDNAGDTKGIVTPGESVQFADGNATTVTVDTEANGNTKIKYDVKVDDSTIKVVDGKLTGASQTHFYSVNSADKTKANYNNDGATGENAIAAGPEAKAAASNAVVMGNKATVEAAAGSDSAINGETTGEGSVAVGALSKANGKNATAIGQKANAYGQNSFAGGQDTESSGKSSVAIGDGSRATDNSTTAVGPYAKATKAGASAFGFNANAQAIGSVAVGRQAQALNLNAVSVGNESKAKGEDTVAIGTSADAVQNRAMAIGKGAVANGADTIAFGAATKADQRYAIAIGSGNNAWKEDSVALGRAANANGAASLALGLNSHTREANAIALGNNANADDTNSIAIGTNSKADQAAAIAIGNNVKAKKYSSVVIGEDAESNNSRSVVIGYRASATNPAMSASNQDTNQTIAIGSYANAWGDQSTAIGNNVDAKGNSSIAIGADDWDTVAVKTVEGTGKTVKEVYQDYTGDVMETGSYTHTTSSEAAVAIGTKSQAIGQLSTAFGTGTIAEGVASAAFGMGAKATQGNSVAIGAGSTTASGAIRVNEATVNNLKYSGFAGGNSVNPGDQVSFGSKNYERQLKNVAPGEISNTSTDAINGSQLYAVQNVLGNTAQTVKNVLGGDAAVDENGSITMSNIGNTGKGNIHDAIKSVKETAEKGWKLKANEEADSESEKIAAGDTVTVKQGKNIRVKRSGKDLTIETADDVAFNKVTVGDSVLTTDGLNTPQVTAGDSVLGNNGLTIANGANPVSLTKSGLNNGGNKIANVAKGTEDTDGVNVSQIKPLATALNTTVGADGSIAEPNFTVNHADGTAGTPVHTVQDALNEVGKELTKGLNIVADNGSSEKVNLGDTVKYTSKDKNIVTTSGTGKAIDFSLAEKVTIGKDAANGGKPVVIDGKEGIVSGLTNTTLGAAPLAGSNKAATEAQLDATQVNLANVLGGNAANNNGNVTTSDIGGTGEDNVHDAIKSVKATADKGWKLKANDEADSESEKIAAGDTVTVKQGKNIRVKRSGKDLTIETADDVAFNKVTVGDSVLTTTGLTTPQVTAGDSVLGNNGLTIANGAANAPVSLTKDGLNNGGNKVTNVAKGTADTDGVNVSQLKPVAKALNTNIDPTTGEVAAPSFTVTKADGTKHPAVGTVQDALDKVGEEVTKGINVGGTTGSNKYALGGTINIKGDSNIVSDTVEGGVQLKLADTVKIGQDSGKPVSIDGTTGTVSGLSNTTLGAAPLAGSNKAATEAQLDATQVNLANVLGGNAANNNGNVTTSDIGGTGEDNVHDAIKSVKATADKGWKLKANDEADSESEKIAAGDTVTVKQGKNIRVKRSGKDLTIETADDVAFNKVTVGDSVLTTTGLTTPQVTAGDSVLGNNGLTIANGAANAPVSLTKDGLNNGGNKVTNVAKGTADTDGVNVSQLKPVAKALNTNIDPTTGEVAAPSFTVTKADGTKHPAVGTVQDALDKVGEEVTKGLNIVADNGSSEKVNLGDTVKYTSKDKNIVTTSGTGKAIDFSLAEKVTIGKDAANGGKPVVIDGKEGIVSGLTNTTLGAAPLAGSNKAATEAQLDATQVNLANVLGGNAANNNGNVTTSDIGGTGEDNVHDAIKSVKATADKGWKLKANDEADSESEKIAAGDTVTVKQGKNIRVKRSGKDLTIETADDVAFNKVTVGDSVLTTTGLTTPQVTAGDSVLGNNGLTIANGAANAPVSLTKDGLNNGGNKVTNVAKGTADTDGVNVSQLKPVAKALNTNIDPTTGEVAAPSFTVTKADGTKHPAVGTVQDALDKVGEEVTKGLNIVADNGSSEKVNLGDTVKYTSKDKNIVTTSGTGKAIDFSLAEKVTIGKDAANGGKPVVIDGKEGIVSGLTNTTLGAAPLAGSNKAATEAQLDATQVNLANVLGGNAANNNGNVTTSDIGGTGEDNVHDAIKSVKATADKGWNLNANDETSSEKIGAGDTVTFKEGKNVKVSRNGKSITIATSDDVSFKTVTVGDSVLTDNGLTVGNGKAGKPVSLTKDGLNNGGNKIANVAAGEADTDAVNVAQLKAAAAKATSKVESGNDNIVVAPEQNADGSTTYKVATAPNLKADSFTAGDTVVNKDGVKVGDKVALGRDGLKAGDVNITADGINAGNKAISNVAEGKKDTDAVNVAQLKAAAAKATSKVESGNDNIVVTPEQNADGSTTYKVATAPDLKADSLTTGDTVVNNDGVKVGDKVALTKDGLDNGGNKVANVAAGEADTDAVNVAQLKAAAAKATSKVESGNDNIVVTPEQNADGSTTYKVATAPDLKADSLTTGDTVVNNDGVKVGDKVALGKDGLKAGDVNITADGINAGNKAISNVAEGKKDTDAVNVGQLNRLTAAAKTEVEAGTNIASVSSKQGANKQTVYTINADGASVSAGSDKIVVTKGKKDANNVTDYAVDLSKAVKDDIAKGVAAKDAVDNKGISFAGDSGTTVANKLGDTVAVKGDANITTTAGANGIQVGLNKDLKVDSVTTGGVTVNAQGISIGAPTAYNPANTVSLSPNGLNNGGQRITNVAPAKEGTDAVNLNQLVGMGNALQNNIANVGKKAYAGVAGAIAQGSIPQVTRPGATGIGVGSGYYGGQSAMAIGVSAMSDGGNWIVKGNFSANTDGHVGVGAGALYQW